MNVMALFDQDEDGLALADAAGRWLEDVYSADTSGFSAAHWKAMAAAGWLGLRLPEEAGGLGLGVGACLPLATEFGKAGVVEPVVESAFVAAPLCAKAGADGGLLAALGGGTRIAVLAPSWLDLNAGLGDGVSCTIVLAPGGAEVTDLLVPVRHADGTAALYLIAAEGAERNIYRSMNGARMSDWKTSLPGAALISGSKAQTAIEIALAERAACHGAQAVGAMGRAIDLTAAYLHERRQFGRPLADFQVLSHRIADMTVDWELSKSTAAILANAGGSGSTALTDRALAHIARAARLIGERAIQLHGGMGMTEEMEIGHVFRRLLYLATALGGETAPRMRVTRSIAERAAAERGGIS